MSHLTRYFAQLPIVFWSLLNPFAIDWIHTAVDYVTRKHTGDDDDDDEEDRDLKTT